MRISGRRLVEVCYVKFQENLSSSESADGVLQTGRQADKTCRLHEGIPGLLCIERIHWNLLRTVCVVLSSFTVWLLCSLGKLLLIPFAGRAEELI
jgi:hypothetical protein